MLGRCHTLVPDWRGIGASPAYAVSASTVSHVVKLSVDTSVQAAVTQPMPLILCSRWAAVAHAASCCYTSRISASTVAS
jgi:hypothetical protein